MLKNCQAAVIGLKGLPAFGGAATVGENIIDQLKDQYNFTVYSISSHTNLKTGNYNGYQQIVFKKIPFKKLNTLYYYILSALHALFLGKYNFVHLHHRDAAFIIPLLRLRYKVILTTHGMVLTKKWSKYSSLFIFQDKLFLKMANSISCVSKKDQEFVANITRKKYIVYIPNGVNISNDLSHNQKIYKICFAAGRIVPDKGCHTLLKALVKINFQDSIVIIGDLNQIPSYKTELLELSKSLPNVLFTGLITDKSSLYKYISQSEIFVYPSIIESMSMMLLEVASLKTPIMCCDIRENKDIFDSTEVLYFEPNSTEDLINKLDIAINDKQTMCALSEAAFIKVQKNNNWKDIAKQYQEIYNKYIK